MTAEAFRCADAADSRDEPLYGTASYVRRWLLLEQPGPWGRHALLSSGIPHEVAIELRRRARSAGVRIVLIRRGTRFAAERRHCYFVRTEATGVYQAGLEIDSIDELLDVDLGSWAAGAALSEVEERREPIFLVCTHGRHDACCAIRGNQVSRVACAEPGVDAWECSHIGGDRFAANVVCFPHGIYYGRIGSDGVTQIMHSYRQGVLSLDHYRGRCCYPFPVQAAEYFVRRETGTTAVDAVTFVQASMIGDRLRATFAVNDALAEVQVRTLFDGEHRLTCRSLVPEPVPRYELASCTI